MIGVIDITITNQKRVLDKASSTHQFHVSEVPESHLCHKEPNQLLYHTIRIILRLQQFTRTLSAGESAISAMALHAAFKHQLSNHPLAAARANVTLLRLPFSSCRARAGQQQRVQAASSVDTGTPEACAMQILQLWQDRNLEGLLPFLSELSVVKAVVR